MLLTSLPLDNETQARQCLELYSYRWLIERYHYTLKSGCQIEKLQLDNSERIIKALATYSIVAWRLLWLTYEARKNPQQPITKALTSVISQQLSVISSFIALWRGLQRLEDITCGWLLSQQVLSQIVHLWESGSEEIGLAEESAKPDSEAKPTAKLSPKS